MGYGVVSVVLYGVPVSEEIAAHLNERFNNDQELQRFHIPGDEAFIHYRLNAGPGRQGLIQDLPVTPYAAHNTDGVVFQPYLLAEGTDSRSHSNTFEPGFKHYVGIYIASNGYAYFDDTTYFLNNFPPEAARAYEQIMAPILEEYGVTSQPQVRVVQQVW